MTDEPSPCIAYKDIDELGEQYRLGETAQEILLEESAEHRIITDHIAAQAQRSIRIFTRDLEPLIYDRSDFINACRRLAIGSRFSRVEILAFESKRIIFQGHQLVELARALSSRIEIRQPEKQYKKHRQAFITFDESAYIYRSHAERFEGVANYNDPGRTRLLESFFKDAWIRSHINTEMRRLNI